MFIIAGLGNPGGKYEHTRHNCGFEVIDILSERFHIDVDSRKFKALAGNGVIGGQKVLLMKPQTFMNLSGEAVQEAVSFYKADPASQLIVLYDDISLDPGLIRVRAKGSAGGHNGIRNIIQMLGTDRFLRVKIGTGGKPEGWDLADYVLGHFPLQIQADMTEAFERASRAAEDLLTMEPEKVMSRYNQKTSRESEPL